MWYYWQECILQLHKWQQFRDYRALFFSFSIGICWFLDASIFWVLLFWNIVRNIDIILALGILIWDFSGCSGSWCAGFAIFRSCCWLMLAILLSYCTGTMSSRMFILNGISTFPVLDDKVTKNTLNVCTPTSIQKTRIGQFVSCKYSSR